MKKMAAQKSILHLEPWWIGASYLTYTAGKEVVGHGKVPPRIVDDRNSIISFSNRRPLRILHLKIKTKHDEMTKSPFFFRASFLYL